jgi:hypothetical protein
MIHCIKSTIICNSTFNHWRMFVFHQFFTKILTIILSVKIVLTLRVKLPCPKCKILIVREMLVLSFIVSEKNRKKDGRCIGAST